MSTAERTDPAVRAGLRLAVSLLTIVPVRSGPVDRGTARWAMTLAPVAGLLVGAVAAAVLVVSGRLGFGSGLAAALAVGAMALLTRGLHLDGLADLADGLGSGRPATEALAIMKKSDIGPFGVITLVLTLAIQVAAIAEAPVAGVVVAAMTGRLAVTWACRSRVRAARPEGLGALVAGTVRRRDAVAATAVTAAVAAVAALTGPGGGVYHAILGATAVLAGLAASTALLRHAVRRLGGVTGDVLGALVETSVTAALLVMALR
ncbi:adenosylcobinamide-GDP ribazoletransferase [Actinomadura sp. DC4]|uniref:adenosylcobinamide-GDP ribazoletransferase n=1 Tax=Actinomadura sp. DC4 TaxID=3055069 RepID=UPI0025AF956A|nr:adenosylcobinamide-GDP ribazoletransferase [Actinomadura sp. DC4]MDN3353250.1 adenosylcobinamide-GDP ribazoletransferase [Actinomadura sp. DC4]